MLIQLLLSGSADIWDLSLSGSLIFRYHSKVDKLDVEPMKCLLAPDAWLMLDKMGVPFLQRFKRLIKNEKKLVEK